MGWLRGKVAILFRFLRLRPGSSFPASAPWLCSETTPEGSRVTKLDQILLNGNNIAIVSPPATLELCADPAPVGRPFLVAVLLLNPTLGCPQESQ